LKIAVNVLKMKLLKNVNENVDLQGKNISTTFVGNVSYLGDH